MSDNRKRRIHLIDNILNLTSPHIKLRSAHVDDMAIYFEWVNDTVVRQQSFSSDPVLWEGHVKWFLSKMQQQGCLMLVMEANDIPVGQIRFDIGGEIACIDYSLDRKVRGRHWGEILVNEGMKIARISDDMVFQAEVKKQNTASIRIFLKLGFDEIDSCNREVRIFRMLSGRRGHFSRTGKY